VEASAEALAVVFVKAAFAAQDLGNDARAAEDIDEVFLFETVSLIKNCKTARGDECGSR